MMTLEAASTYFDRTQVTTLAGVKLFKCQIENFDDSKRDAGAAYRRIMSVKAGTQVPIGTAVKALGRTWLVGNSEPDGLASIHREKYVIHPATETFNVSTLSGYLTAATVAQSPGSAHWVKDSKQLETSSDSAQIYDLSFPRNTSFPERAVVWSADAVYLNLAEHNQASGLKILSGLRLPAGALGTATVAPRTYDPVVGSYTLGAGANLPCLRVRWQSLFAYGSQMAERYQEGDVSLVLPAGTVVDTASLVSVSGQPFQVLAVLSLSGAVVLHAREI